MILPTISAVSREVLLTVPRTQREAALALGATRWETIRMAVLPTARGGIIGAIILGLGRALGETIAVLLVIGGARVMHASILQPGYTMASVIANEFVETTNALHAQSLVAVALILFMLTLLVNMGARLIIRRGARKAA
jgi:phosphate transport system permease protein